MRCGLFVCVDVRPRLDIIQYAHTCTHMRIEDWNEDDDDAAVMMM